METIAHRLAGAYPKTNANWSAFTIPLVDQLVGQVRPALVMVLAAAGCVLLIGASNLANLFLVRLFSREREIAVRTALGATRGRLVRELLAEAGILGVVAGAVGDRRRRSWGRACCARLRHRRFRGSIRWVSMRASWHSAR